MASLKTSSASVFLILTLCVITIFVGSSYVNVFPTFIAKSMDIIKNSPWTSTDLLHSNDTNYSMNSYKTVQWTLPQVITASKTISPSFHSSHKSSSPFTFPTIDFRQRYLSWYGARPDITSRLGTEQGKNSKKYLIFRCDKRWACGGWGSRIVGMTQGYLIANLTGRSFKMEILDPQCNLTDFFFPHMVDWSLPKSFHHQPASSNDSNVKLINYMSNTHVYNNIYSMNLTKTLGEAKYVYLRTDLIYSEGFQNSSVYSNELSWMRSLTRGEIVSTTLKHLLKPNSQLVQAVKNYLSKIFQKPGDKLICAHVRMGRNPTIPNDSEIRTTSDHLPTVWQFLKNHSTTDSHKIFFMSDSTDAIQAAKNQSFAGRLVPESPGRVAHIERGRKLAMTDRCDALHKVIFDQQVLMNCDILLISRSSLSRIAAYVRDSDDGLYCLLLSNEIVPCKTSKIIQTYKIIG